MRRQDVFIVLLRRDSNVDLVLDPRLHVFVRGAASARALAEVVQVFVKGDPVGLDLRVHDGCVPRGLPNRIATLCPSRVVSMQTDIAIVTNRASVTHVHRQNLFLSRWVIIPNRLPYANWAYPYWVS